MNKKSKDTNVIEHIIFPYSDVSKEIFLNEKPTDQEDICFGGNKIASMRVSEEFKEYLKAKGFEFVTPNRTVLQSKKKICGVDVDISKNYVKGVVKEILVTISAVDTEDMIEKKRALLSGIKAVSNLKYRSATTDKFLRC